VTSMPDDWKLLQLAIERIFDSRCATTPPLLPPVPNTHALSARGPRCCKLDGKHAVDKENGLVTGRRRCARTSSIWCWGTSRERKEGDSKGTHTMLWLALVDFDNSAMSNDGRWSTLGRRKTGRLGAAGRADTQGGPQATASGRGEHVTMARSARDGQSEDCFRTYSGS